MHRGGVGVKQQLLAVAAHPRLGIMRPVHAVAVALPSAHVGQIPVPHVSVDLDERHALLAAVLVEETELDSLCHLAEDRKVGAAAVERRAQWMPLA